MAEQDYKLPTSLSLEDAKTLYKEAISKVNGEEMERRNRIITFIDERVGRKLSECKLSFTIGVFPKYGDFPDGVAHCECNHLVIAYFNRLYGSEVDVRWTAYETRSGKQPAYGYHFTFPQSWSK